MSQPPWDPCFLAFAPAASLNVSHNQRLITMLQTIRSVPDVAWMCLTQRFSAIAPPTAGVGIDADTSEAVAASPGHVSRAAYSTLPLTSRMSAIC